MNLKEYVWCLLHAHVSIMDVVPYSVIYINSCCTMVFATFDLYVHVHYTCTKGSIKYTHKQIMLAWLINTVYISIWYLPFSACHENVGMFDANETLSYNYLKTSVDYGLYTWHACMAKMNIVTDMLNSIT